MTATVHFTSVRFKNYKAFNSYTISLNPFNILVGPNNAGKSTVIGAFRILTEGIRRARVKRPIVLNGPEGRTKGYNLSLSDSPMAAENIFYNYNDHDTATIKFRLSNGNELLLYFPEKGVCHMFCYSENEEIVNTVTFKRQFNVTIGFVPILGPVEHYEPKYQMEAARLALQSFGAARNFRNIWFHYPDDFDEFRDLVQSTWPGMDIEPPEVKPHGEKPHLFMFCPEVRMPREIYWAGFGFQVWCQLLTYIIRNRNVSLFIIDEPDIYLHSDLQRQLLSILKNLGPDIIVATHSTEIISDADPDDLLMIDKKMPSARRVKNPGQLQRVFDLLGSNLNPILTQLAKTKKAVFVEGKDFQVLSRFARAIGENHIANRAGFAVISVGGFNPKVVKNFKQGIEYTLGSEIKSGVIFDRDYRSDHELNKVMEDLSDSNQFIQIHSRKELENFLLMPNPIKRAIQQKLKDKEKRTGVATNFDEDIGDLLMKLSDPLKTSLNAKYQSKKLASEKIVSPSLDDSTIIERILEEFESKWQSLKTRMSILPGKEFFRILNSYLQEKYGLTLTDASIISSFKREEIPEEMLEIMAKINSL